MRMRRKKNPEERMEACGDILIQNPLEYFGEWRGRAFDTEVGRIELEIGCGKGKFIIGKALSRPDIGFIAIEKNQDVLICALERAKEQGIRNVRFIECDALLVGDMFAQGELDQIYLNFSDPWPKSGYRKRRLTSPEFLSVYKKFLPDGARIAFKTDNQPFYEDALRSFEGNGFKLIAVTRDLHNSEYAEGNVKTEYEEMFSGMGKTINYVLAKFVAKEE